MTSAFEARYRADPDPWRTLTDPYESHKRERTLAACGEGPFASACDLGAGTGILAAALAPRCERLLALDGAPTAVAEAERRLAPFPHATARTAQLPDDLPAGPFDLVVASEILYYLDGPDFHTTLTWITTTLLPGGRVVAVHWTGSAPDLARSAADVGAALAATPGLRVLDAGAPADGFRLDVLERTA
jgi:trans-aconitate methyltransferase